MPKKKQNNKYKSLKKYPTLFVLDGAIKLYDKGSLLELYSLISSHEWERIVEETIKYKVFLECLKGTAFHLLNETWTENDDWFRLQLDVAVSRMSNIDPLLVAKWDQNDLTKDYTARMKESVINLELLIEDMKGQQSQLRTVVSEI